MKTAIYLRREIDYLENKQEFSQLNVVNDVQIENLKLEIAHKSDELVNLLEEVDCPNIDELEAKIERKEQVFIPESLLAINNVIMIISFILFPFI